MRAIHMLLTGVITVVMAQAAIGDVIMTNLEFADDAGGTIFGPDANTEYKAYGWTMPDAAYSLDLVTLRLAAYNQGEARVSIWSGETVPETELMVLDNPAGPGEPGYFDLDFTPPSSFTLEANTSYWVYVEDMDGGGDGFLWGDTDPQTLPTGIGTSIGFIFNGNPSTFTNALEISGTLIPTPPGLCLLGLTALAVRRRRRG